MRFFRSKLALALTVLVFQCLNAADSTKLSEEEVRELNAQLEEFYANPTSDQMNEKILKYLVNTGHPAKKTPLQESLELKNGTQDPLKKLAGKKSTDDFQKRYCEGVLSKKFPELKCQDMLKSGKATREANDKVEDLVGSWVEKPTLSLDEIPVEGQTELPLWSDDYWRIQWGATSYRYASEEGYEFNGYDDSVKAYTQPAAFSDILGLSWSKKADEVYYWSPAEKYDMAVGDTKNFSLTNQQKYEGDSMRGKDNDVEAWMGICHGWAAAAMMVPKPNKPVTVKGAAEIKVEFLPHDVRALASLAWANGQSPTNYVGGRCNYKDTTTHRNGRLKQQECFDVNPATMVHALGNMVGIAKKSFVMDKTFDYEVWNQPIYAYKLTYFNPLQTKKKSADWREVAVSYNSKFKRRDRFQQPLTRGTRLASGDYDDKGVKKVVGVAMTIVYLAESEPTHGPVPTEDQLMRVTYTADLELHSAGRGKYVALGGEWHQNAHPDFLWVPLAGATAQTLYDRFAPAFDAKKGPTSEMTLVAEKASEQGYPLCTILENLVKGSSGKGNYACKSVE